ncbi:hypothetical protein [Candidatus Mycobacterium methanotrophicum]|uniref:Uncharacterized protein n=1 Tax=Candidatus Mycobacterium methanotrophicum TaxID=2943498 RepID=A0ABY4QL49_9MYCO|nr:hypothetical protein [Candidatus Mycobacterium methanotrophicum]UQX10390.1 hypothetical protein M5I08_20100 [Candidatus Mycobacterium methanotrophicum]
MITKPAPGVFAMDNQLYREVARKTQSDQARLQAVFEEAERRRALGQSYTLGDYLAEDPGE